MPATVLYEDSRGPSGKFGFHRFLCQCVADQLDCPLSSVERQMTAIPKKGDSEVLKAIERDASRLARGRGWLLAVFDNDKIRRLLQLAHDTPDGSVVTEIKTRCELKDLFEVVLLDRNMESVLAAVKECAPRIQASRFEQAIDRKNRTERDNIFQQVTFGERSIRDCILGKNKSVRAIRDWMLKLF